MQKMASEDSEYAMSGFGDSENAKNGVGKNRGDDVNERRVTAPLTKVYSAHILNRTTIHTAHTLMEPYILLLTKTLRLHWIRVWCH